MSKLNIDALAAQYTTAAPADATAKPDGLDDRGDGQATLASLEAALRWAAIRWPNPAKLRDNGATLSAIQEVSTGIDAYRTATSTTSYSPSTVGRVETDRPDVTRATQAAAWLLR